MIKWLVAPKVDDGLAVEGLWEQVDWRDLYGEKVPSSTKRLRSRAVVAGSQLT